MIDYRNGTKGNGMEISNMQATSYAEWTGDRVHVIIIMSDIIYFINSYNIIGG